MKTKNPLKNLSEQDRYNECYPRILVDGEIMYVGSLLERAEKLYGDHPALMCDDTTIVFKDLYYRACLLSNVLRATGVNKHDKVLLWYENSIEFYVAYFAIIQLGAVVAPLNTFLGEKEFRHIVEDAQPACMIISPSHMPKLPQDMQLPPIITHDMIDMTSPVPDVLPPFKVEKLAANDMVALLYTSGTTGVPKGVMLTSRNIMTNVAQGMTRLRFGEFERERVFGVLPLFHSFAQFACVWAPFFAGCAVIIVPKIDRRQILHALKHQPTIFLGVPALYGLLCMMKTAPIEKVKYFISGGDAMPDKIRGYFALIYGRKICSGYGLTETSPLISVELDDVLAPTNVVGKPAVGIECLIKDADGNTIDPHQIGELWVKGDNVMLGYYNAPQATAEVLHDGWFQTGDLAYFDEYEKIVISGRSKDLIIHKGFNIYPQEIENIILTHPLVIRAAVIGRVHEEFGEVPIAYVQLREADGSIEAALRQLCTQHLAGYKVPKDFIASVDELPTTATGKVNKKALKELDKQHA